MSTRGAITYLFCLLLPACAVAQQHVADSLAAVVRAKGPTVQLLNDLAWAYMFHLPDSGLSIALRSAQLARSTGDLAGQAQALNRAGVAYDVMDMPDSALALYERALPVAERSADDKVLAGVLNNMGMVHWNLGANDRALELYLRATAIFERTDNLKGLSNTYNNIGLILLDEKRVSESLRYQRHALAVRQKLGDKGLLAASMTNIGLLLDELDMVDSAIWYQQRAIPLQEEIDDRYGLAKSCVNMGTYLTRKKRTHEALGYLNRGLAIYQDEGNRRMVASTHFNMASVYLKVKDMPRYRQELRTTVELARGSGNAKLLWKACNDLALELNAIGEYREAAALLIERNAVKDSLFNMERSEQMALLERQYQTERKDRQIAQQETELAQRALALADRNRWIALLAAAMAVLLLGGGLLFQYNRRRAEREHHRAMTAEREAGLRAVLIATEDERKRIAKDLHDGTVQSLTGIKMRLQRTLSLIPLPEAERPRMDDTMRLLDEATAEVRSISHQMMPRVLSESGLVPALADMLDKSLGSTPIRYSFEHMRVEGVRYRDQVEISLFRICQELINNIVKHSGAKAVSVQLMAVKDHLVLLVEDDGSGFRPEDANQRNGIGLMNISSRVESLHGRLDYSAQAGRGTVATVRVPIAEA
jgi:signal transduction histidine kinase